MDRRQAREIDSLKGVKQFVEARGRITPGLAEEPTFRTLTGELAETLAEVNRHAAVQYGSTQNGVRRTRDRNALRDDVRRLYLEPLREYAEELAEDERYQLQLDNFRLPSVKARLETFLAAARSMLAGATEAKAGLLAVEMPADFLDRFAAAVGQLDHAILERKVERTQVIEAQTGLAAALDRAWRVVKRIDRYFRAQHPRDDELHASWGAVRRSRFSLHATRNRSGGGESGEASGSEPASVNPQLVGSDAQRPAA